jgi:hypothetical protein
MSDTGNGAQEAYWKQLVTCKIVSCYIKYYRDSQARWINITGIFKAVVTSSTIGAWVVWKQYAIVWGLLLAATQVLDAIKEYIPQTKGRRAASEFVQAMESLIIDARFEWFSVFNGDYTAAEIMDRWRKLAKLMNEIETKYFPDGLPADHKRQKLAERDAQAYFLNTYGVGDSGHE